MERESFVVDLEDPEDVRAKHGEALVILDDYQALLQDQKRIEAAIEKWKRRVAFLAAQLPQTDNQPTPAPNGNVSKDGPSTVDLAVEVVNREVRKIRPIEVCRTLKAEGHELSPTAVSNALYYAAHTAKPNRINSAPGRGFYAPLAYKEDLIFDSAPSSPQAQPAEPYSAPQGEDRGNPPGDS